MPGRRGVAALGVLLAVAAMASAQDTFRLGGQLRGNDPLVLSGAVAILPDLETGTALLYPGSEVGAAGQRLLEAETVHVEVIRKISREPQFATRGTFATEVRRLDLSSATLQLTALDTRPQVLAYDHFLQQAHGQINATVPRCHILDPEGAQPIVFPDDPGKIGGGGAERVVGEKQLEATCKATQVEMVSPQLVSFYGMTLLLRSSNTTEEIRTGTFEEADTRGLPTRQKVTQILQVTRQQSPVLVRFPFESDVRLYSHAFLGVGNLGAGPSEGSLAWGDLSQQGRVDPFTATGEFRLAWGADRFVGVDGTTLNAPQGARNLAGLGPLDPFTLLVTLAATGLLVLALRLLWPLFSKLRPDQVLDHPRRSRILEFVRAQPGVETNTVAHTLGFRWANLVYHVGTLARSGHLTVRRIGGRTALFPANMGYRGKEEAIVLLRRDTTRRIHEALQHQPGLDQVSLAHAVGLTQQRISQSLRRLEGAGMVRSELEGRRRRYFSIDANK